MSKVIVLVFSIGAFSLIFFVAIAEYRERWKKIRAGDSLALRAENRMLRAQLDVVHKALREYGEVWPDLATIINDELAKQARKEIE